MGSVEPADIVSEGDLVWRTHVQKHKFCCVKPTQRMRGVHNELKKQLQLGLDLTLTERDQMETPVLLLTQSDMFALSDEDLGETDLVSHRIDTRMEGYECV